VDTNKPKPNVERIYRNDEMKRKNRSPLTEISNTNRIEAKIIITARNPSITKGISLPIII